MVQHAKPFRATLISLLMLVALAEAAIAFGGIGDFPLEEAQTAYQRGDYATAYRLLKALGVTYDLPQDVAQAVVQFARLHGWRGPDSPAGVPDRTPAGVPDSAALEYEGDQGYLPAQWKLGRMYAAGDGVPKDDQRAFTYFSQIANTHPDEPPGTARARMVANAFVALGHYYLKGIPNTTVAPDAVRARDMFTYAASHFGDADAQYQLGRLYLDGSPSDPREAARWFQLAATKGGDCRAEAVLGQMLFEGQQVPRQAARGLMWLTLARDCIGTDNWDWILSSRE